ncbi:MAG: glycosyltransferase family 4 protein [Gemmatimonadetes bacterium]|nr:glycosyltransferase family 4 protein [Gemmatimonadota bacterium]
MRVLLDARTVGVQFSGVGNYVLELVRAFAALDADHEFVLMVRGASRLRDTSLDSRFRLEEAPFSHENHPLGDLWEHFVLPRHASEARADVLHGPAFLIPMIRGSIPTVVTIHDLVAYTHRNTIPLKYGLYMRWLIAHAVERATRVITDSESVRENLLSRLPADPARVHCVPLGVSADFRPPEASRTRSVLDRLGIRSPYYVFVGNLEPRKNLPGLLRAYRLLKSREAEVPALVIAGKIAWKSTDLRHELDAAELAGSVITTGYVEPEDLPALYSGAEAFVFPTFWEGFGLPVLEAMACGVPVVASGLSSIPEVAGDAAELIDPHSTESIANGMRRVAKDRAYREELIRRGLERVTRFTWRRTALATLDVYEQARRNGR